MLSGKDLNVGKRFLYGALVLTFVIWVLGSNDVHASNIESSFDDTGLESGTGTGGLDGGGIDGGTEQAGHPDYESGTLGEEQNSEIIGEGVSEILGEEPVKVQNKTFALLDHIESGQASQTDIYNALVSIHNLGLVSGLLCLMVWTYNMITSTFRRFIG